MGDGEFCKNPDATIPLKKSYRMSLISAGSISLDSTFKYIVGEGVLTGKDFN